MRDRADLLAWRRESVRSARSRRGEAADALAHDDLDHPRSVQLGSRPGLSSWGARFKLAFQSRLCACWGPSAVAGTRSDPVRLTRYLDKHRLTRYLVISCASRRRLESTASQTTTCSTRFAQWHLDDDFTMRVGPAHNGDPLEVGVLGIDTDDPVIVHAMRARPQNLPHR